MYSNPLPAAPEWYTSANVYVDILLWIIIVPALYQSYHLFRFLVGAEDKQRK